MEKLKRFFSSLMFGLMAVCAMTLSACGDDDDDNGGLLLTSISCQSGSSNYMNTYCINYDAKLRPYKYSFEYDDFANDILIIDYDNGKMDMPDWDGASNLSLSFNSKGYITKVKGSWSYAYADNYAGSLEWNASYDKDGHLTEMTTTEDEKSDEYNEKGISKTTLSWTGGNLVSYNSESKWYDEDGQVVESDSSTGIFTYGTQQNKYKQYPAIISVYDYEVVLFKMGLFGLGPNNLPTSYNEVYVGEYEGNKSEYRENYTSTFTLNDNGSIDTEIWASDRDNYPRKYMYSYSDVNSVSRGITRSVAMTSTMSASDKAKRIRDFMHKLPFVPKRRSSK